MISDTVTPGVVEALFQLSGGAVLPRCLQVVADIGVADALNDTPKLLVARFDCSQQLLAEQLQQLKLFIETGNPAQGTLEKR